MSIPNPAVAIIVANAASGNTQATTSTAAKLVLFSTADTGANLTGSGKESDYSLKADKANDRVLAAVPGAGGGAGPANVTVPTVPVRYRVRAVIGVSASGNAIVTMRLRKNGTAITTVPRAVVYADSGLARQLVLDAIIELNQSDLTSGSVQAFADPPAGGVVGAAFAPYTHCPLDFDIKSSASVTLTFADASVTVERIN